MKHLARRLQKLEAGILDSNGLIPNTPEWLDFWGEKLDRLDAGEDVDLSGMTLAVVDAIIAAAELEETEAPVTSQDSRPGAGGSYEGGHQASLPA